MCKRFSKIVGDTWHLHGGLSVFVTEPSKRLGSLIDVTKILKR